MKKTVFMREGLSFMSLNLHDCNLRTGSNFD